MSQIGDTQVAYAGTVIEHRGDVLILESRYVHDAIFGFSFHIIAQVWNGRGCAAEVRARDLFGEAGERRVEGKSS